MAVTGKTRTKSKTKAKSPRGASKPSRSVAERKKAGKQTKPKAKSQGGSKAKRGATTGSKTKRKAAGKARTRAGQTDPLEADDSALIEIDLLEEVDELVDDEPPLKTSKARGPRTPSVPRSVKPAPKVADVEMSPEVLEFIGAIDDYRQRYCRPFPTWTEVWFVIQQLGYRKA
ncbi:MAG: hypothetical protein H6837_15840 [Planctomycetes bacterium]|nr:hypothetical protein [Planctomycetota bacterium]